MRASRKITRVLTAHLVFCAAFIACMLVLHFSGIACPVKFITGLPCPTCGLTRATFALLRLDFAAAAFYNPAAPLILPLLFLIIHYNALKLNTRLMKTLYILGFAAVAASYIIRLCMGLLV